MNRTETDDAPIVASSDSDSYWLNQGEQTRISDLVRWHARQIRNANIDRVIVRHLPKDFQDDAFLAHQIAEYINRLELIAGGELPKNFQEADALRDLKIAHVRKRTVDEILQYGRLPTCCDESILLVTFLRAFGVPTSFVETFYSAALRLPNAKNHSCARIYSKQRAMYVNIEAPEIHFKPEEIDLFPFVVFREGLDSWDLDIRTYEDLKKAKADNLGMLLLKAEEVQMTRAAKYASCKE